MHEIHIVDAETTQTFVDHFLVFLDRRARRQMARRRAPLRRQKERFARESGNRFAHKLLASGGGVVRRGVDIVHAPLKGRADNFSAFFTPQRTCSHDHIRNRPLRPPEPAITLNPTALPLLLPLRMRLDHLSAKDLCERRIPTAATLTHTIKPARHHAGSTSRQGPQGGPTARDAAC